MKKIFLPFLFVILLSSCDEVKPREPQFPLAVNGTVEAKYYFTSFSADVNTAEDSAITLTVNKPALMKDWVIILDSNGTTVKSSSITFEYENDQLEKICPPAQLYDILTAVNTEKPQFVLFGESYSANFEYNGKKCVVFVNADKGTVEKISTQDCVFTFKNEEVVTG